MLIEIRSRFDGKVLFEHDCDNNTIRLAVEAAVKIGANLSGANLSGANLSGANLSRACLSGANLDDKSKTAGERPVLQIGPIGSRAAYLVAYVVEGGVRVRAGCWFGTLAGFTARVKEVHGNTPHGREYSAAITMIKAHARLWGPKAKEVKP
jgi:hypothetical protein